MEGQGHAHLQQQGWGLPEHIVQDPKALTSALTYTTLMAVAPFCLH